MTRCHKELTSQPQKETAKMPSQTTEPSMFIQRHRVAYDTDGCDIVAGFKDVPIEKWTDLEEARSFEGNGIKFYCGDFVKAPLPNRFIFANYAHKPLVETIAHIEEIRKPRDAAGYAVLVQWFITKEAAEWWKCCHVKALWPKEDKAGIYVPATIWDVLSSEFLQEQEKQDPEEIQGLIIQNMFFELDAEVRRLYLKQGQCPDTGIALGNLPHTARSWQQPEAEDAAVGLPSQEKLAVDSALLPPTAQSGMDDSLPPRPTRRGYRTAPVKQQSRQGSSLKPSTISAKSCPHKSLFNFERGIFEEGSPEHNSSLERSLADVIFPATSLSPAAAPDTEQQDTTELAPRVREEQVRRITLNPTKKRIEVTLEEQKAVLEFLKKEQSAAEYKVKDVFAAAPEYDPANVLWDREAKIAEIKARPSRKARFTKRLAYARLERPPHALHVEVNRPLPKTYKAPSHRPPAISRYRSPRNGGSSQDVDIVDGADMDDPNKPEVYETLEELLGLPANPVPMLYQGTHLAFRDGTLVNARLPRAKEVWKVGRNVPGELK